MNKIFKISRCAFLLCATALFSCSSFQTENRLSTNQKYHIWQTGDTLNKISRQYQISAQTIKQLNSIYRESDIVLGKKIYLPKTANLTTHSHSTNPAPAKWSWPVAGDVRSEFGPRGGEFHKGIDIAAIKGTLIYSVANGRVVFSGKMNKYGNVVIIVHNDQYKTLYAHNSKNLVKTGDRVFQDQPIAEIGKTGNALGYHLHFEVLVAEKAKNPRLFLASKSKTHTFNKYDQAKVDN